jgi:hypothetical protein
VLDICRQAPGGLLSTCPQVGLSADRLDVGPTTLYHEGSYKV